MAPKPGSKNIMSAHSPRNEKEELLYYKGVYQIRELVVKRLELMGAIAGVDNQIAKIVSSLKQFATWKELGDYLHMSEQQARTYFLPLMGEIEGENERNKFAE